MWNIPISNHRPTNVNLNDACKSDNINVHYVCFTLFYPSVDRVQDRVVQYKKKLKKIANFWQKSKKKKKHEEKKMNLPFQDKRTGKEKWMRMGALRQNFLALWITLALSRQCKYHIFGQYWHTRNVLVFTNTEMCQYLGPQEYLFKKLTLFFIGMILLFRKEENCCY